MESFSQKSFNNLRRTPSRGSSRSLASTTSSGIGALQTNGANGSVNQNGKYKIGNGTNNVKNAVASVNGHFTTISQGTCGTAEVRLQHDAAEGTLSCTAVRARGLPSTDLAGLADPYCSMEILPPGNMMQFNIKYHIYFRLNNHQIFRWHLFQSSTH